MIVTAQQVFDSYLRELDKQLKATVKAPEQALIMAEAMMVKVKELFMANKFVEDHSLLFMEHALQELDENTKPTIH